MHIHVHGHKFDTAENTELVSHWRGEGSGLLQ